MFNGKKLAVVVPTRKGSQRVKNKNTRPFADTTLLELKLRVLQHVKGIDNIIVNTDCEESINIAKKMGISYHKRDEFYASSEVTNDQHWSHLAQTTDADVILMAQTTSPLVKTSTYEKAIEDFFHSENNYDSVNSVTEEKKFLWLDGKAINYDSNLTPKSQDLPDIVSLNFAITLIEKEMLLNTKNVIGSNPDFIKLSKMESIDVDDMLDFEFAEFLYQKLGFDWLIEEEK